MAAQKARRITHVMVNKWDSTKVIAKVADDTKDKGYRWINVRDLSRVELMTMAGELKIDAKQAGRANFLSWSTSDLADAIEITVFDLPQAGVSVDIGKIDHVIPSSWTANDPVETVVETPVVYETPALPAIDDYLVNSAPTAPAVSDDPASADPTAQVASAIATLMATMTPKATMDEGRVRELITEGLAEVQRPIVNIIALPGRDDKQIDGRQHVLFDKVLRLVAIRSHVYLVGPPGTGKSTLAHQCAEALSLTFSSISLGPTTPSSRLWGYYDANGNYVTTAFRKAYESGGVFLFDEMDNGHPGILAELNQALANGGAAFPDEYVKRHPDFVCVAAANTYGTGATSQFIGRNALDAATLDRFVMLTVPLDEQLEEALALAEYADAAQWITRVRKIRANVDKHGLKIVVSPRAVVEGAKMLAAGFTTDETLELRVLRGVTADQRFKMMEGAF